MSDNLHINLTFSFSGCHNSQVPSITLSFLSLLKVAFKDNFVEPKLVKIFEIGNL